MNEHMQSRQTDDGDIASHTPRCVAEPGVHGDGFASFVAHIPLRGRPRKNQDARFDPSVPTFTYYALNAMLKP